MAGSAPPRLGLVLALGMAWHALDLSAQSTAAAPTGTTPPATDMGALRPGQPVEHALAPEERHGYSVMLAAGEYVEARVDQLGIDVIVEVLGPDGKDIETVDHLMELENPELVQVLAEADGPHRLVVHSENLPGVKAGRYRLVVDPSRPGTADDRAGRQERRAHRDELAAAEARLREITQKPDQAEYKKAFETLDGLLGFYRAHRFRREEALTLELQGTALTGLEDFAGVVTHSEQRLTWLVGARYAAKRARATTELAEGLVRTGETQRAIERFKEAVALPQSPLREAITLDNLGGAYRRAGQLQQALDAHLRSLESFGKLGARRSEGVVLTRIALVWEELGDLERALAYETQAQAIYREVGDQVAQARSFLNLAGFHLLRGEVETARENVTKGQQLAEAAGNATVQSQALIVLGAFHNETKEYDKAVEVARRALPLHRARGDRQAECWSLGYLAVAERGLGHRAEAADAVERGLAIARETGDGSEPSLLRTQAELARDAGDLPLAQARLEEALQRIEQLRRSVGGVQLRTKFAADKRGVYEDYVDVLQALHGQRPTDGFDRRAFEASELSRAKSLLDVLAASYADVRTGIDPALLHRERQVRQRLNDKDLAGRRMREARGKPEAAARLEGEAAQLTAELELIESEIRAKSPAFADLTQSRALSVADIQRQVLDPDTVLLEYALGAGRSWLWAVTASSFVSVELDRRDLIESDARGIHELLAGGGDRRPRRMADEARLREGLARLGDRLLGPVAGQLQGDWAGKRLLIVAPGALEYLPFAALPQPGARSASASPQAPDALLAHHEIVNIPSASVMAALRREAAGRRLAPRQLAILADPVFDENDPRVRRGPRSNLPAASAPKPASSEARGPDADIGSAQSLRSVAAARGGRLARLPFSRQEAEAIAALVPPDDLLKATDFAANRAWATSPRLGEYRILHFATHGLINAAQPELSSLVLSLVDEGGQPRDGLLRMHDIYNQRLPVELVVLSACQTALGREFAGEGLVGLTRGFMYAGAKRVVASLWQVDDLATAELMRRFYRGMLVGGKPPAAALRLAQLDLMKQPRWSSPFFWAGFTIQGEWR